jgi:hypothetical protein
MVSFSSNSEFFEYIENISRRLAREGNVAGSKRLMDGMSCVNGLTDGWGMFMDAIASVLESPGQSLSVESEAELREALATIRPLVYR